MWGFVFERVVAGMRGLFLRLADGPLLEKTVGQCLE